MKDIEYKVTMVEQKVPYIITCRCDRCNKTIYKKHGETVKQDTLREYTHRASWYEVMTGHNDWGNDSCDSIEHKDICPKCLVNEYSDYVDSASGGYNTKYIRIEHKNTNSLPIEEAENDTLN